MFYKLLGLAAVLLLAVALAGCGPEGAQAPGATDAPLPTETAVTTLPEAGGIGTSPLEPTATTAPESTVGTSPLEPTATAPAAAGDVEDLAGLMAALEAAGATVELGDPLTEEMFPGVTATFLNVNGTDIQVSEFPDEASREAATALIQGNGWIIGNAQYEWIEQPFFWATGRLIVLYVGSDQTMVDLLSGVLGDPITGLDVVQPGGNLPVPVQAAIDLLSQSSGAAASDIEVVSFDQVEWTDSCLGLGGPAESCLQAITPGWLIVLRVDGQTYEFHTDLTGENIRQK